MKKVILLAVVVSLLSGCTTTKKRSTQVTQQTQPPQQSQLTVNAVVAPSSYGTQKVSVSTNAPGYAGGYNVNVSVSPEQTTSKLLSGNTPAPRPITDAEKKDLWYSSAQPSNNIIIERDPTVNNNKSTTSRAKIDPNTNKVIWLN